MEDHRSGGWREIRHYACVERKFDGVWRLLAQSPAQVLADEGVASGAFEAALHMKRAGVEVSREVRLRFGGLVCDERRARLSLRWESESVVLVDEVVRVTQRASPAAVRSRKNQAPQTRRLVG